MRKNLIKLAAIIFISAFFPSRSNAQIYDVNCPLGTTVLNQAINPTNGHYKAYICIDSQGNVIWATKGSSGSNPEQTVSPLDFGARGDVLYVYDCSWANASQSVTCPDGNFVNAPAPLGDVNKICLGVSAVSFIQTNAGSSTPTIKKCTITAVNSSTNVTVSSTSTAACPTGIFVNCNFARGTQDDTAALNAAGNAAWNTSGTCKAVQLGANNYFFSGAIFNPSVVSATCGLASGNGTGADINASGPSLFGCGPVCSVLIPLSTQAGDFSFANCTGTGNPCIGGIPNLQVHDLGVNGLGQPIFNAAGNFSLFQIIGSNAGGLCAGGTSAFNLSLSAWGFSTPGATTQGFDFGRQSCNDPTVLNVNSILFGDSASCLATLTGNIVNVYGLFCMGGGNHGVGVGDGVLRINGSGTLNSYGSQYFCPLQNNNFAVHVNGPTFNSFGDRIDDNLNCNTPTTGLLFINSTSVVNLEKTTVFLPSTTSGASVAITTNNLGSSLHMHNVLLSLAGANNKAFNLGAADSVFDECGNTEINGSVASTFNTHFVGCPNESMFGVCLLGGSTGTTSPAACGGSPAGTIAIPASQTTYTVNDITVTSNSKIIVQQTTDNTGLPASPTCNAGAISPIVSGRTAGTSFTIALTSVASVTCFTYTIFN